MVFIQRRDTDRKWAHCFVVTGTQLLWDFRFCLWSNLGWILLFFLAKSSVRCFPLIISTLLYLLLLQLLVFVLTCSLFLPSTLTRLWGTALFLSSQVVDEGGIQRQSAAWLGGLGSLGGSLVLTPFHRRLFFPFSWGFSSNGSSVTTHAHTHELTSNRVKLFFLGFKQTSMSSCSCFNIIILPRRQAWQNGMRRHDSSSRHMACGCEIESLLSLVEAVWPVTVTSMC